MRSEKEVLDQVLSLAQENDMVRAVVLNGSRVNPNVTQDIFCDYDIAFHVTDAEHFLADQSWIKQLGDPIIVQQNDWSEDGMTAYIFLMLFTDGVRIDLAFDPLEMVEKFLDDSLTLVLLDKDGSIRQLPPPSDTSHCTPRPTRDEFDEIANEFWWCSTNVAKGIWREELSYAKGMYEVIVRECIIKMLSWYIGVKHDWSINPGSYGKWFKKLLPVELWEAFEKTYAGVDYQEMWAALFEAGRLVRRVGVEVAEALGYEYPIEDDARVSEYLKKVSVLPQDAESYV
jgi:aminoglycoside 6-adenylyltransferase